jgi:hypothetical protein
MVYDSGGIDAMIRNSADALDKTCLPDQVPARVARPMDRIDNAAAVREHPTPAMFAIRRRYRAMSCRQSPDEPTMLPLSAPRRRASGGYSAVDLSTKDSRPLDRRRFHHGQVRGWFFTEVRLASKGVGRHAVILVDAVTVVAVGPIGKLARVIARRTLKPLAVEIDDVPGLANVVFQQSPG